jgi:hypothetical protein
MKYTTGIVGGQLEIDVTDVRAFIEQVAFFHSLPQVCPICGSELRFNYKKPQGFDFFGMVCRGEVVHETNLGQPKDGGLLYYKNEWTIYDREAGQPVRVYPPSKPQAARATTEAATAPVNVGGREIAPLSDEDAEDIFSGGDFLSGDEPQELHRELGRIMPLADQKAFATHVLKRPITSFGQVKKAEEEKLITTAELFVKREPWRGWRNEDDAITYAAQTYGPRLKAGQHVNLLDKLKREYDGQEKRLLMKAYYDELEELPIKERAA